MRALGILSLCLIMSVYGLAIATAGEEEVVSALSAAKGQRCEVYLKSGEIKRGKLTAVGQDYLTVEVKLSPFYAEPQTFRLTQVSKVDLGRQVVDVEALLTQSRQERLAEQTAAVLGTRTASSEPPKPVATVPREPTATSQVAAAPSNLSQPTVAAPQQPQQPQQDETVRRLMAILRDMDESPASGASQSTARPTQRVVQPEARQPILPNATVPTRSRELPEPRPETRPAQEQVPPASTLQTQRGMAPAPRPVVPVEPRSVAPATQSPMPAREVGSSSQSGSEVPAPKPTVPSPKPPRGHLSAAPEEQAMAQPRAPEPSSPAAQSLAANTAQEPRRERAKLDAPTVSTTPVGKGQEPEIRAVVDRFYKAAMVLAGAVVVLAGGVVVLAVTVARRKNGSPAAPTVPVPAVQGPAQPEPPPPLRLVMVKGEYAVVDQGLDHGVRTGDLLLVKRSSADGDYELGLARVLKVFDRLSGIKMVEKFADSDLRVGDVAYPYQPAEPTPGPAMPVEVRRVEGNTGAGSPLPASEEGTFRLDDREERYLPSQGRWRRR
ncbi:MAG: hypothetical protein ONB23_11270 [candidate division KSB1 bacterium]|nr:hypothetical protein [candidate division KSB1 bacterium]